MKESKAFYTFTLQAPRKNQYIYTSYWQPILIVLMLVVFLVGIGLSVHANWFVPFFAAIGVDLTILGVFANKILPSNFVKEDKHTIAFYPHKIVISIGKNNYTVLYPEIDHLYFHFDYHYYEGRKSEPRSLHVSWTKNKIKEGYVFKMDSFYLVTQVQKILKYLYQNQIPFGEYDNDTPALLAPPKKEEPEEKPPMPIDQKYLDLIDEIGKTNA